MRTLGASSDTIDLVDSSHRLSTHSVYSHYWEKWLSWCSTKSVDPIRPADVQLANFLSDLFVRRKLALNTVKGYRSAISTTIAQLGGRITDASHNPFLLRDVIRGASIRDARIPRRAPAWDLFLVLASLRRSPYEPASDSSLKWLTLKTAFLTMLASGRRGSEVHSFSGSSSDIAFERDGAVSLRFLPEFLAKNQVPGVPSPIVRLPALTSILGGDDEDRLLCPVRALRFYLQRVRPFRRATQRRLFISYNPDFPSDISLQTLSRWLKLVIQQAYQSSALPPSTHVHEIRAWSASLAFQHSVPLNSILEAAYWRSVSSFTQYYLRDTHRTREDGSIGLSSAVVAQTAVSLA